MPVENNEFTESCFEDYLKLVHKLTGITISKNRKTMVSGRVRRRLAKLEISSYGDYLDYVKKNSDEEELFINAMTTNETYFYRTPRVWDFVTNDLLASWDNKNKLNIWSAASSTGEEAHTLGIVCEDHKNSYPEFSYKVTGTDISTKVTKIAADGNYKGRAVERFRQIKPDLFKKYMKGDDENGYKVLPEIKSKIKFSNHNLFKTFSSGEKFDLILLRNVLIYFTKEDQEKVLANIHKCLKPEGYLIIGESESLSRINTDFNAVSPLVYSSNQNKKIQEAS